MGELRDDKAVQPLCEVLKDGVWSVRQRAAEALGKIGNKSALSGLVLLLKDRESKVRDAAMKAINQIKSGG